MKRIIPLTALSLLTVVAFATGAQAKDYTVKMISYGKKANYYFEPKTLTIHSGDTVTWVNTQEDVHNVMSESVPKGAEAFDSGEINGKGKTWSHSFTLPGTYEYHCHPHRNVGMVGTIIVDHPSKPGETEKADHDKD